MDNIVHSTARGRRAAAARRRHMQHMQVVTSVKSVKRMKSMKSVTILKICGIRRIRIASIGLTRRSRRDGPPDLPPYIRNPLGLKTGTFGQPELFDPKLTRHFLQYAQNTRRPTCAGVENRIFV
jgi:hypothetical protein